MSDKCHICKNQLKAGICNTNRHVFETDADGNFIYVGRYATTSPKKFVFPQGYLTYFAKMHCQLCSSSLDGLLEYDSKEPLKCNTNGHESYLTCERRNDKYYDEIIVIDRGVKAHISLK